MSHRLENAMGLGDLPIIVQLSAGRRQDAYAMPASPHQGLPTAASAASG